MKTLLSAPVLALALCFVAGAPGGVSRTGLRGKVLVTPSSTTCRPGTPCTRPAAHVVLEFWVTGRMAAHTRTDGSGRFRIALRPRTYRVTSALGAVLNPPRVTVRGAGYHRITFELDTGLR